MHKKYLLLPVLIILVASCTGMGEKVKISDIRVVPPKDVTLALKPPMASAEFKDNAPQLTLPKLRKPERHTVKIEQG